MDFSFLLNANTWIIFIILVFLEIVLGIDNIVFISITTNKLPENKQSLGRKLGLAGAFCMRCLFLVFASWLVQMKDPLFTIFEHSVSLHDLIMLAGGTYLIFKGIKELRSVFDIEKEENEKDKKKIGLLQAVITIMLMDIVFSIDSVITAVGLCDQLIVMISAVLIAIIIMIVFIDKISNFINKNYQMTILALVFIIMIGGLLILEGLNFTTGIYIGEFELEKALIYFAMIVTLFVTLMNMRYVNKYNKIKHQKIKNMANK